MTDEVTKRAVQATQDGTTGTRPLFQAAQSIVQEEEAVRRQALADRAAGDTTPLDPEIFPPNVFDADGKRKRGQPTELHPEGPYLTTKAEDRAAFEWRDGRGM